VPYNRPIPESSDRPKSAGRYASLVEAEKMIQIAILLPSAAVIGWMFGAWLDGKLHQNWLGLVGLLFGGFSGLFYVIRLVTSAGNKSRAGNKAGSGTTGAQP
jgi:F0F1-type ATP synthase assembly protein I